MFIFISVLVLALIGVSIYAIIATDRFKKRLASSQNDFAKMRATAEKFQKLFQKYKAVPDVEAEVERQKSLARKVAFEAEKAKQDLEAAADRYAIEQQEKARDIIAEAEEEKQRILSSITSEARKATEEAAAARSDKAGWEAAARAIKNIIKGYGDEYLVPGRSVLDDLAEGWGHKEAGAKLKEARGFAKAMVIDGTAAACDYAEAVRKETAINFVIDAFNGRVDAVLSKVRHDNFGKLSEQIRDIYAVVNHHGEAFKNARITPDYLLTRLDELRWAVAVFELKEQEKEEQARIREQMRDEERARKEFEKAQKDAEKEERELQRKMKDAEQRLKLSMAEADKNKLLAEIAQLQFDLKVAEEKGQKAISMAQQTKRGHVYVISNIGSFGEDVYKIGLTRRLDPLERVAELGDASVPFPFDVHAIIYAENAPTLESTLHNHFMRNQVNKCNPRKEFFRLPLKEIKKHIEMQGLTAEWTMAAEAREYHETLAIEKEGGTGMAAVAEAVESEELAGVE